MYRLLLKNFNFSTMSSIGNSNYKDCSQGMCSKSCPQFCYLIFPPPPQNDDSNNPFSPLIITIICVLVSAFLLVGYYTIVSRYCKRRNVHTSVESEEIHGELGHDQWHAPSYGLDEDQIKNLTVCKYKNGDGLMIEGTDCAVCLSGFQENENLRLLPKCSHAFHLPCIDTWLKSHSNCPLCRANVVISAPALPSSPPNYQNPSLNLRSYEVQRSNDLVLVVEDQEIRSCNEHVVLSLVGNGGDEIPRESVNGEGNSGILSGGNDGEGFAEEQNSIPLGTFSSQCSF